MNTRSVVVVSSRRSSELYSVENDQWVADLQSEGDKRDSAIENLREILLRGLSATCRNQYGGKVQAEDVVQEALIKILDKLDTFEGRSKFTTWALTIAVRVAISEMRRKHFKDVSMDKLLEKSMRFEPAALPEVSSDIENEKLSIIKKLRELIDDNLTDKQREAVHCLLNGMPVEIFAEKTGSNRNAVYKLVHDARVKLRQGFEQAGYKADDVNSVFV